MRSVFRGGHVGGESERPSIRGRSKMNYLSGFGYAFQGTDSACTRLWVTPMLGKPYMSDKP